MPNSLSGGLQKPLNINLSISFWLFLNTESCADGEYPPHMPFIFALNFQGETITLYAAPRKLQLDRKSRFFTR